MNTLKSSWNVIYTRPRHEKKVVSCLADLNVEHFLPMIKTLRVSRGRKKYMVLPLFPSYVFVKPGNSQLYFDSLQIPGVVQYVRTGREISEINESVIDKLRVIDSFGNPDLVVSGQHFTPGQTLKIPAGPFTGFTCEVIQYHGKHKILVRIELLHRSLLLDIPEGLLMP